MVCRVTDMSYGRVERPGSYVAADWRPQHTGLVCAESLRGSSQWVLPQYEGLYGAGGAALLSICESVHESGGHAAVDVFLQAADEAWRDSSLPAFLSSYPVLKNLAV